VRSEATRIPIPIGYPVVGRDVSHRNRRTRGGGNKAFRKGDEWLADMVYSGVPAKMVGREQLIEIGPMSGKSNIVFWLERHAVEATEERVERILAHAKQRSAVLTDEEVMTLI
jgi:2-isopropylmalate synthase